MVHTNGTSLQDERYLLLETLGHGGMGRVYRAFDRTEQRLVALKVPGNVESCGPSHPLSTEFEAWSWLDHPNIVRAYELGTARSGPIPPGTPYLVLEHVDGGPAHHVLEPRRLDSPGLERTAARILHALDHVHGRGLVHRDLKPGNVLVDPTPRRDGPRRLKLTDFGLAAPVGLSETLGTFSGSIPYVAPESLLGEPIDARADLYGLGILLFRLATGRLPVAGSRVETVLRWHLSDRRANLAAVRPDLSDRLTGFVRRLTARNRDDRPASAASALELIESEPPPPEAPTPDAGSFNRVRLRLALDAARLGAIRVLSTSGPRSIHRALENQISVWAQVRGLRFFAMREGPLHGPNGLGTLVLQLLLFHGSAAGSCVRRHGLQRALPIDLLGPTPVLDASRSGRSSPARSTLPGARTHARTIRDFILESTSKHPVVLWFESGTQRDPLVRRVVRLLATAAKRMRGFQLKPGGLLVVLADGAATATNLSRSDPMPDLPPTGAVPAPTSTIPSDLPEAPRSA